MVLVFDEEDEGVMTETEAKRRETRKVFQVRELPKTAVHSPLGNGQKTFCVCRLRKIWLKKV